jgi:hypothetical protein
MQREMFYYCLLTFGAPPSLLPAVRSSIYMEAGMTEMGTFLLIKTNKQTKTQQSQSGFTQKIL